MKTEKNNFKSSGYKIAFFLFIYFHLYCQFLYKKKENKSIRVN